MLPLNYKVKAPTHSFGDLSDLKPVFVEGNPRTSAKPGYLELPRQTSDGDLLTLPLPAWDVTEMGMTKEQFNAWLTYVKALAPGRNRHERRSREFDIARRYLR